MILVYRYSIKLIEYASIRLRYYLLEREKIVIWFLMVSF
jgi:hypothetical protein